MFCGTSEDRDAQREAARELPPGGCDDPVTGCTRARLIVIVLDSAGAPVPGAEVQIAELGVSAATDASGRYDTGHVAPGRFNVLVRKPLHFTPASADEAHATEAVGAGEEREVTLVLDPLALHLHLDADRDGVVDADRSGLDAWDWGAGRKGAVVLCNNDGDGSAAAADNADRRINGGNDASEIAPLELRRSGPLPPANMSAVLRVDNHHAVRVFDGAAAGANEVIGPTAGDHWALPNLGFGTLALGMEALRYADGGFSGELRLSFEVSRAGTVLYTEHARLRVAPWMMPNHLDTADEVHVVNFDAAYPNPGLGPPVLMAPNTRFRTELDGLVRAAGCSLVTHASPDQWMQDCMEFGYASSPTTGFRTVAAAYRKRPLRSYPQTLRAADRGFHLQVPFSDPRQDTTYDSTGNLECTPPVTSAVGKAYPFGRIYYGGTALSATEVFNPEVAGWLNAQQVQAPINVDTTWLAVGHVDEFISIAPGGPKGFKLVLASPRKAYQILDAQRVAAGASRMLRGRKFPHWNAAGTAITAWHDGEVSIRDFLATGIPALGIVAGPMRSFNETTLQGRIDTTRNQLKAELGLAEADIIDAPVLFRDFEGTGLAEALTGDTVNMLVANRHCVPPKAFGPVVGGVDLFEQALRGPLTALGLTVNFLDDWYEYHVAMGEVHCGTNTYRQPTRARWWEHRP